MSEADPTISNCLFKGNECYAGGAIGCYLYANPLIENNIFTVNAAIGAEYAQGYGGAICVYVLCDPTISNNIFTGNTANNGGGAIGMVSRCKPMIDHNLFYDNWCNWIGGAIEIQDTCSPYILNNTIIFNTADFGGGIDCWDSTAAMIRNNIIWGNTAPNGNQVYLKDPVSQPNFEYCDIEGGQEGFGGVPHTGTYAGCFDEDPLLTESPEFCLSWENFPVGDSTKSPCIDAGSPTMIDPDGTRCDVGYCYFPQPVGFSDKWRQNESIPLRIYPNPSSGIFDIRYSISDIRSVEIGLYDLSGKLVLPILKQVQLPGEHKINISAGELPDGIYFIRFTSGADQVVKKLLIRK